MEKYLLILCILSASFLTRAQDRERIPFSRAVEMNIRSYAKKAETAYRFSNVERAEFLFDSIIDHVVKGSVMDNFEVRKRSGRKIDLYQFDKPIFLITQSTWCMPGEGEIPALNKIVDKYHKEIDFVVLFWDSKRNVRKATRKYSSKIHIVYVDETDNKSDQVVRTMKHSFGFPASFFIDKEKTIVDLRRSVTLPYNEEFEASYQANFDSLHDGVTLLMDRQENDAVTSDTEKDTSKL